MSLHDDPTENLVVTTKLTQTGNSVAARIPAPMLKQLGLGAGSSVNVQLDGGAVVIRAVKRKYDAATLRREHAKAMRGVKEDRSFLDAPSVGKEGDL